MLARARSRWRSIVAIFAPQIVPIFVPGFDAGGTELTDRLTRIMLALADPAGAGRGRVVGAQRARPLRRGRDRAVALQPGDHRRRGRARAVPGRRGAGHRRRHRLACSTSCVQLPAAVRGAASSCRRGSTCRDASVAPGAALMAPRAIGLGREPDHVHRRDDCSRRASASARSPSYNVAWTVMQIPLGVIGFPLGVVLLPSMSRAVAAGLDARVRRAGRPLGAAAAVDDAVRHRRRHRPARPGGRRCSSVAAWTPQAISLTADTLGVPASWAWRLFAGHRLRARLLQRPGHAHAGDHRADST